MSGPNDPEKPAPTRSQPAPRSMAAVEQLTRMDLERAAQEAASAEETARRPRVRRKRRSLFRRLLVVFISVLAMYAAFSQLLAYRLGAEVLSGAFQEQFAPPLLDSLGDAAGALLAEGADAALVQAYLDRRYATYPNMTAAVYSPDARRIAQRVGRHGPAPEMLTDAVRAQVRANGAWIVNEGLGFERVGAVTGGPGSSSGGSTRAWVYLAGQPSARGTLELIGITAWQWALPVLLLSALAAYLGTRSITDRLRRAEAAVRRMARGDLSVRMPIGANDEIGRVAISFNRTADLLERTVRELEAIDENRRRLVADFAHELNTPLTNVLAYLETLQMAEEDGSMDPVTRRGFIEVAYDEALRLAHLARDLETLTKLEAGQLVMEQELVDLSMLAVEMARRITPRAEKEGLAVHTDIEPGGEMIGDHMRLEQVGMNLLENALRYTNEGSITVRVRASERAVVLEVQDTGVGISAEDLPRVMDRFYRVDQSRNRSTGGSGLGLAIVGRIVERHGGTIELESILGEGTCFRVRFPQEGTVADQVAPADAVR